MLYLRSPGEDHDVA
ncbi:hypothetical protein A2U01_0111803, partial [Trifolium medium]|nr:hypothetical protein [Trifolium medium]